jgi:hypothetical protein
MRSISNCSPRTGHGVVYGIAEERLGDDYLPLGIPIGLDPSHLLVCGSTGVAE